MTPRPVCRFRPRFVGPTLRLAAWMAIVTEVLMALDGERPAWDGWLVIQGSMLVASTTIMGLFAAVYRLRVTATGLRSPDWPWLGAELAWEEIAVVRRVNLLGFRFLALYQERNDFGVWLPLFLRDEAGFWRLVRACVDPNHPLFDG